MAGKKMILGVTGSIAAYKACGLVREFIRAGYDVTVVMTSAALKFVSELTFRTLSRNKVYVEMFEEAGDWCPEHISLSERCDVLLIAPCTANVLAKVAHGIADDLLSATVLSCSAPVIIAPAMNERMWDNPATVDNIKVLRERGIEVLETDIGDLACGSEGRGRLAGLETIMEKVDKIAGGQ